MRVSETPNMAGIRHRWKGATHKGELCTRTSVPVCIMVPARIKFPGLCDRLLDISALPEVGNIIGSASSQYRLAGTSRR